MNLFPQWMHGAKKEIDFNFPQDVSKTALADLGTALKTHDGELTVDALIRYSIAQSGISDENLAPIVDRIEATIKQEKRPEYKALLYYFEAVVFSKYMQSADITRAKTVEGEEPAKDYTEWNRDQFNAKIGELLTLAMADREALQQVPVTSLTRILKYNELGALYVPTLYQFLSIKCRELSRDDKFKDSLREPYALSVKDNVPATLYAIDNSLIATPDKLIDVYKQNIDNEHCGMLLDDLRCNDERYTLVKDYLARHPNGVYAAQVHNILTEIEAKNVRTSTVRQTSAHKPIKVEVRSKNAQEVELVTYRMPDRLLKKDLYSIQVSDLTRVGSKKIKFDHTIPFEEKQTVMIDGLDYGVYAIVPVTVVDGKEVKNGSLSHYDLITVSDLVVMTMAQQGQHKAIVVNRETGAPVEGVTVEMTSNYDHKVNTSAVTGKDGIIVIPAKFERCQVKARKGNDKYGNGANSYRYDYNTDTTMVVNLFTDLGIYRPGEKVKWSAVAYSLGEGERKPVKNHKFDVTLNDPNDDELDTLHVTTDQWGRIEGEFTIPTDRLNGRFRIEVEDEKDYYSTFEVNVSEYKTPTFEVKYNTERSKFVALEPVVLEGEAMTYSGMPVANSEVKLTLCRTEWTWNWRYWYGDRSETVMHDTTVTTDAKGHFKVELEPELFPENKSQYHWATYNYVLKARVTNAGGESQEASKRFIVGSRASIEMPDECTMLVEAGKKSTLPITYNTTSETETSVECTYEIVKKVSEVIDENKEIIATGSLSTADPQIDLSKVPSGEYIIKVHALTSKDNDYDLNKKMNLVVYRENDKQAPVKDSPLWVPVYSYKADANGKASILVGTSSPEANIYYVVASHKGVEKSGWLHYTPGLHKVDVTVPARDEEALSVKFMTVYKGKEYEQQVSVSCDARQRKLNIEATSFRDKLVPGDKERWTLRVTDKQGRPMAAAVMLEMFDKALNKLADNTWQLNPEFRSYYKFNLQCQNLGYINSVDINWQAKGRKTTSPQIPELNLYNQQLFGYMSRYMVKEMALGARPMMMNRKLKLQGNVAGVQVEEISMDMAEGMALNEVVVLKSEAKKAQANLDNVTMRMADVKTALWRPTLSTDAQGNVVVEFEAPQFNTTWIVQAVAWDKDMYASSLNREVLTQKPVMVKSALPRFVRTGDKACLTATVMNATDEAITAQAVIELFDPRSQAVIATREFTEQLQAKGTNAVSIDWDVPQDMPFVGFRVKAATSGHSDGEQVMLPVLASTQPIIETQPFYIEQGEQSHTVTVPQSARDARVTLEYCDNPTWYAVTALPTIFDDNYNVSTRAAHALFTIDVAQGIAASNPKIKEAVDHWNAHPEDSVLVSMLAKNQDLKIGTLLASPWLRESDRQTLRMSQIGRLMNKEEMKAERKKVIDALLNNQLGDGGFCWYRYPMATSSVYTTHTVLELIGEIKQLGYLPSDDRLDQAVKRALKYYDHEWLRIYRERKDKKNYSGFDDFVYVRTLFKDVPMESSVKSLFDNSIKAMKKDWEKGLSLSSKAFFALTLERNGEHKTAALITESIRQHAISKPALGMYWDNLQSGWRYFDKVAVTATILQALNEVDHRQAEIDQVRKWILLMKQTNDWGSSSLAADAVYSLLATGTDWLQPASSARITVDDKAIDIADAEKYLGYVRRTINVEPGAVINIERNGKSPAWGAVYSQFQAAMSETKAVAIDELSISKQYYIYGNDGKLVPATSLKVGDKVQVRTIIKCNRDLDFVTVVDERASCFEPVDQLSGYRHADRDWYYLETKDSKTNIFFSSMNKGTHVISYDVNVTAPGTYNAGVASAQCQYAPQIAAHSAGTLLEIK